MTGWLDKAKEAAAKATEEAKKLAEAAKNADYGAMVDKTKNMASHAAEEAKKAAGSMMKKEEPATKPDIIPEQDNPQAASSTLVAPAVHSEQPAPSQPVVPQTTVQASPIAVHIHNTAILAKIAQVEQLLQEIKTLLK